MDEFLTVRGGHGVVSTGRLHRWNARQPDHEGRPLTECGFDADRATVCLRDLLHDRQPETCATLSAYAFATVLYPVEPFRQPGNMFAGNADAVVFD